MPTTSRVRGGLANSEFTAAIEKITAGLRLFHSGAVTATMTQATLAGPVATQAAARPAPRVARLIVMSGVIQRSLAEALRPIPASKQRKVSNDDPLMTLCLACSRPEQRRDSKQATKRRVVLGGSEGQSGAANKAAIQTTSTKGASSALATASSVLTLPLSGRASNERTVSKESPLLIRGIYRPYEKDTLENSVIVCHFKHPSRSRHKTRL